MTETLFVSGRAEDYPILFDSDPADLLDHVAASDRSRIGVVLADEVVWRHHGDRVLCSLDRHGISPRIQTLAGGESAKSLTTFHEVVESLLRHGFERRSILLAVGGGTITDLGGFVAGTFFRGVEWIAAPTTILGMVDAAIGGKTGINLSAKNIVGVFHSPRAVLCAWSFLASLPARECRSGLAEVIKSAVIRDRVAFDRLLSAREHLVDTSRVETREALVAAARVKAAIVSSDETEQGERAVLNFGHTIGHALEAATRYERWTHGEAVSIGMMVAAELSRRELGLSQADCEALERLLRAVSLPVADPSTSVEAVQRWIGADKKRQGGEARFVLTPRIGSATFGHLISQTVVEQSLARFFEPSGG